MINYILNNLKSPVEFIYQSTIGWRCGNNKDNIQFADDDMFFKRVEHTKNWCLANNRNFSFQQTLFLPDPNSDVRSRQVELTISKSKGIEQELHVNVLPSTKVQDVFFHSDHDLELLNAMSDALIITEADIIDQPGPKIVFVNKAFERMTGFTAKEVLGKSPRILQGEGSEDSAKWNIRKGLTNWDNIVQNITNYRKDGRKFTVELNISPVKDITGWYTNWISVQRDISEEIRHTNKSIRTELALEAAEIGTWSWELDSKEVYWDEKVFELYGLPITSNHCVQYEDWAKLLHPDDKIQIEEIVQQAVHSQQDWHSSFRIIPKNSSQIRHIKARAKVMRSPADGKLRMLGVNWDVTKEVMAQIELEKQQKVAMHNARLASLGELAAGIGHEINNPLSIISVLTDVMSIKLDSNKLDKQETHKTLNNINNATKRIEKIVKSLKSISLDQDEKTVKQVLDLNEIVQDASDMMNKLTTKNGLNIIFDRVSSQAMIVGDPAYIQQIFVNLANNAIDAVESKPDGMVKVGISSHEQHWRLTVYDNGMGINESIKNKIFAPFTTTKEVGKGTGLGLSISKSLCEKMNGKLSFESSNKGTYFHVDLPKYHTVAASEKNSHTLKHRVLLVEDDQMVLDSIQQVFSLFDCEVFSAQNGKHAIEMINTLPPFDLILTDLRMPVMDGYKFLDKIFDFKITENAKVYTLTGDASSFTKEQKRQISRISDGWIEKPLRYNTVEKLIKELERQI